MTDFPPPPHPGSQLLELYEQAALILRNTQLGPERFGFAASVLCQFFQAVASDDAFWGVVGNVVDNQPNVDQILQTLDDFEDEEYRLLVEARVDELTAAELVVDLRRKIREYRPGSAPATADIRNGVYQMAGAICNAQNAFNEQQQNQQARRQRRSRLRLVGRCFKAAATILAIVVDIPTLPTPVGIGSVVGGVLAVGEQVTDFLADRENDG